MFTCLRVDHCVPAMCLNLAAARLRHDWPSGKAPTTRVRLRISFMIRSSGLLVRILCQWISGKGVIGQGLADTLLDQFGGPSARTRAPPRPGPLHDDPVEIQVGVIAFDRPVPPFPDLGVDLLV